VPLGIETRVCKPSKLPPRLHPGITQEVAPKAVALVAYLAVAGVEVSRRELARLLFPEAEEPLGVLRWHLAHIRTAAPPFVARCLRSTRYGVALVIPTDVSLFRAGMRLVSLRPETPGAAWVRFALAPLPSGAYRVRALRAAVEAEWDSIIAADSLAALGRVRCPVMIVQALKPWLGGRPYFSRRIVEAQLRAASKAELFVAENSDHGTLVRDPAPKMVAAILAFLNRCVAGAAAASSPGRAPISSAPQRSSDALNPA
jgi:hypothetical protein